MAFPNFDDCVIIFRNDRANGSGAEAFEDQPLEEAGDSHDKQEDAVHESQNSIPVDLPPQNPISMDEIDSSTVATDATSTRKPSSHKRNKSVDATDLTVEQLLEAMTELQLCFH